MATKKEYLVERDTQELAERVQAGGARGAVGEAGRRLGCHPASSGGGCPGHGPRHPIRRPSAQMLVGGRLEGFTGASLAGI